MDVHRKEMKAADLFRIASRVAPTGLEVIF
jgi:hypothetical protein